MHIYGIEMHIYDVKKVDEGSCHNCFLDLRVLGKGRKREREIERERERFYRCTHDTHRDARTMRMRSGGIGKKSHDV